MAAARSCRARSKGRSCAPTIATSAPGRCKVAQRLERDGFKQGERIGTLAWNTARHIEAWYGIMGMGGVYHTLNPRLFPEQIAWIMNHAEDQALFVDLTFMPIVEKIAAGVKSLKKVIVLTDAAHMPQTALPNVVPYEEWIGEADGDYHWKALDESCCGRHVLHVGHDRRSQGRGLQPSLERAARDDRCDARRHGPFLARDDPAGRADVPRQRLGAGAIRPDDRRQAGHAGRQDGRRLDLRAARHRKCDVLGRRADGVADAAAISRGDRQEAAASEEGGDRRLRLSRAPSPRNSRRTTTST